jgi:hypothetical protein
MFRVIVTLMFSAFLLGCVTASDTKRVKVNGNVVEIKNVRLMSKKDRDTAKISLILISKIDTNQIYPHLPDNLYWASLGKKYDGLVVGDTVETKRVYVNRDSFLLNTAIDYLHFGALLSHELHHYFYDSDDPYTGQIKLFI